MASRSHSRQGVDEVAAAPETEEPSKRERTIEYLIRLARTWSEELVHEHSSSYGVASEADAEDIVATVSTHILRRFRSSPRLPKEAIDDYRSYVSILTWNALNDHFRSRHPERARLRNRLRYAFTHDARLALWFSGNDTVCGLSEWRDARAADVPETVREDVVRELFEREDVGDAVFALFHYRKKPMTLHALVDFMVAATESGVGASRVTAVEPNVSILESREMLSHVWAEIVELRPMQRRALLLNLRDADGSSVLDSLVFTGVASTEALANALEVEPAKLSEIWSDLPLDDVRIAAMLGMTRQQVINLRKSARARLERRVYSTTMRRAIRAVDAPESSAVQASFDPDAILQKAVRVASDGVRDAASDPLSADNHAMRLEPLLAELFVFREIDRGFALVLNGLVMALRHREKLLDDRQWAVLAGAIERLRASPRLGEDAAVRMLLDIENTGLRTSPPELETLADIGRENHGRS